MRRPLTLTLALCLTATGCVGRGPTASGTPRPAQASASTTRPPVGVGTSVPAVGVANRFISKTRLRAPAGGSVELSGTILVDAGYFVSAAGARIVANDGATAVFPSASLIGQDGASIVANDGATVVAGGAGNIVANDGATIVANDGATIVANDGATIVANDGATIVANDGATVVAGGAGNVVAGGAGNYRIAEAAVASVVDGTPAAAMLVRVINLKDNRPVPVGVDDLGKPVYVILTDARGQYTLHLPPGTQGNLRVVASAPGSRDARLYYSHIVHPGKASAAVLGETDAVVTTYLRRALANQLENFFLTHMSGSGKSPFSGAELASAFFGELGKTTDAAGLSTLPYARQQRVLQRFADYMISRAGDLEQLVIIDKAENYVASPGEKAIATLRESFRKIEDKLAQDPPLLAAMNTRPYVVLANARRAEANRLHPDTPEPSVCIAKPSDLSNFLIDEYLTRNTSQIQQKIRAVLDDLDLIDRYLPLKAAYTSLYVQIGYALLADEGDVDALSVAKDALIRIIDEERSPNAPRLLEQDTICDANVPVPASPSEAPVVVSTLVGAAGQGYREGPAATAQLKSIFGMALDGAGDLYVLDSLNLAIRKIDLHDPAHPVSLVSGQAVDGSSRAGEALKNPYGLVFDATAARPTFYYVENGDHSIHRLVLSAGGPPEITTVGAPGRFQACFGMALDGHGGLVLADYEASAIRRLDLVGESHTMSTLLTSEDSTEPAERRSSYLDHPQGIAQVGDTIYIAEANDAAILALDAHGVHLSAGYSGYGGQPEQAAFDGYFTDAGFLVPFGIAPDGHGGLFVADEFTHRVRRVTPDVATGGGWVTTVAGGGPLGQFAGTYVDGPSATARFTGPAQMALGPDGKTLYVGEMRYGRIRVVTLP